MFQSLRTKTYTVLLITPEKPRLSLLIRDGMFYTHVSFVTELMIKIVPASLTHAKDPSVHSVFEYTREAEIKSACLLEMICSIHPCHLLLN